MIEIWKDILGYEGRYQISNFGNVKSLNYCSNTGKEVILKPSINNSGYKSLTLGSNKNKKKFYIHHLVYFNFNGNISGLQIDHIDGNKLNNNLNNLQAIPQRSNITKSIKNKYFPGVRINQNGSFRARITIDGKRIDLGSYKTAEEAHKAYKNKLSEIL